MEHQQTRTNGALKSDTGYAAGQAILTLLMVPLYFLLDWILRLILETAFGMVAENKTKLVSLVWRSASTPRPWSRTLSRKIIKKKVYVKIAADPELEPKQLEPIKSQGAREMDDSAMIMRAKYKTKR